MRVVGFNIMMLLCLGSLGADSYFASITSQAMWSVWHPSAAMVIAFFALMSGWLFKVALNEKEDYLARR